MDDSRLSAMLLGAIVVVLVLLALGAPRARRTSLTAVRPMDRDLEVLGLRGVLEQSRLNREDFASPMKRAPEPLPVTSGARDLPGIPAFPGAQRLGNRVVMKGFVNQALYLSRSPPSAVATYYRDQLMADGWRLTRLEPLNPGGHGWFVLFRSSDGIETVAIFASSEWLDLPPGSEGNPTRITVDRTNLPVEDIRQALKERNVSNAVTSLP